MRFCESAVRARKGPPEAAPSTKDVSQWSPRDVRITASDGAVLHAWLLRPREANGDCVFVLHGLGAGRAGMMEFAGLFLSNGYTVLAPDNRGLGESGGDVVTYGVREAEDVHRWVSWLVASEHPRNVFGMGESLGAEVLLQSLEVEPRFSAVVAESSFADFGRVARERLARRLPLPAELGEIAAAPVIWFGFLWARLRYGLDFRTASPEAVVPHSSTPALLIHGLDDQRTSATHSQILAAKNPKAIRLWLVPHTAHTGAIRAVPEEFQRRVLDWFASHRRQAAP